MVICPGGGYGGLARTKEILCALAQSARRELFRPKNPAWFRGLSPSAHARRRGPRGAACPGASSGMGRSMENEWGSWALLPGGIWRELCSLTLTLARQEPMTRLSVEQPSGSGNTVLPGHYARRLYARGFEEKSPRERTVARTGGTALERVAGDVRHSANLSLAHRRGHCRFGGEQLELRRSFT